MAVATVFALGACATTTSSPSVSTGAIGEPVPNSDETLICGGTPVPASVLSDPQPATDLPAEVLSVLEGPLLGMEAPLSEWLIAHESADRVTVMYERAASGGDDAPTYDLVTIAVATEHAIPLAPPWGLHQATSCTPTIDLGSFTQAAVTLDPAALPQRDDESIALLVTERACNSGKPATDRVVLLDLVETDTTVEIVIGVQPNTGGTCPSNPPTPFSVDLERPLGDRAILNAAVVPAQVITSSGS